MLLIGAIACTPSEGAEISIARPGAVPLGVAIRGPIAPHDYRRLIRFIHPLVNPDHFNAFMYGGIALDSPGGDVASALRIAELVERSFIDTRIEKGGSCLSSCFLIWAGGLNRAAGRSTTIGVHRIVLARSEVDLGVYAKAVTPAADAAEAFLVRQGIPRKIIDRLNDTPPTDMFILSNRWLMDEGLFDAIHMRPMYLDVVEKKCGGHPAMEKRGQLTPPGKETQDRWIDCEYGVREENMRRVMKGTKDFIDAELTKHAR